MQKLLTMAIIVVFGFTGAIGCKAQKGGGEGFPDSLSPENESKVIEFVKLQTAKKLRTRDASQIEVEITKREDGKTPGFVRLELLATQGIRKLPTAVYVTTDGKWMVEGANWLDLQSGGKGEPEPEEPPLPMEAFNIDGSPTKGPADAKVTIVEFADFQCPACSNAAKVLTGRVIPDFPNDVRVVYKHFPLSFHKWAEPASIASNCVAKQDMEKFWGFYDFIYGEQRSLSQRMGREYNESMFRDAINPWLADNGIDMASFESCFADPEMAAGVKKDFADGRKLGVNSTPTLFINGKRQRGIPRQYEAFKRLIEREMGS